MVIRSEISIDFKKPSINIVHAKQGDYLTRCIDVSFLDGGIPTSVPEANDIIVRYSKPDGSVGFYNKLPLGSDAVDVNGDQIAVWLAPQALSVPGDVSVSVSFVRTEKTLQTFSFIVKVEKTEGYEGMSEDYINYPALNDLKNRLVADTAEEAELIKSLISPIIQVVQDGLSGVPIVVGGVASSADLVTAEQEQDIIQIPTVSKVAEMVNSNGNGLSEVTPYDIDGVVFKNYFDYAYYAANYEQDKIINSTTGEIKDFAGYVVSPKIRLHGGKTYTWKGSNARIAAVYSLNDDSLVSIVATSNTSSGAFTFTVSSEYKDVYIRFSDNAQLTSDFLIVEGEVAPDVAPPYGATVKWLDISDKAVDGSQIDDGTISGGKLADNSVNTVNIKDGAVSFEKMAAYAAGKNLYNKDLADESLWHSNTGTGQSSLTGYFASPLIPVEPNTTYYIYAAQDVAGKASQYTIVAPYNAYEINTDGAYTKITLVSDEVSGKVIKYTTSENAKAIAFNARTDNISKYVVSTKFYAYCPPYVAEMNGVKNAVQGNWAGGTLVALGDSITRGCSNGETLEDGTVLANGGQIPVPYTNHAANLLGMYCKNFGVDGATVKTVLSRINSTDYMAGLKAHPDIITVKIGTNDMAQITLGTIDDVYDSANVTYYSGLKEIARLLSETYPDSTIVFITPLRADASKRTYVKAMEEVAELYDLPCMPMHKTLRYMQRDSEGNYYVNNYYNGLHPNQAAHYRMGRALAGFLQIV